MWAVRYCIVPAYLTACLLCGRNSTFKYFDLYFVLQMPPLCSQSNSNTNFWLKYYNFLKSALCCLFKPVFFHHAVVYTSQILMLRPAYFDQEDELAFLGNFLFIPWMQLVKFSGPSTYTHMHARTLLFLSLSLSLSLSVFLVSKCLRNKLNLSLSPAQPVDSQSG